VGILIILEMEEWLGAGEEVMTILVMVVDEEAEAEEQLTIVAQTIY
jgi:hypothetical protein